MSKGYMTVKKKADELQVGDKIVGQTNFYVVDSIKPSGLTGVRYPVIDVTDSHGLKKTIETGANEKFQDHIYEVELPIVLEPEQPVKKIVKKKKVVKKVKVTPKKVIVKKKAAPKKKVKVKKSE
jgi:hypothetical protein